MRRGTCKRNGLRPLERVESNLSESPRQDEEDSKIAFAARGGQTLIHCGW